MGFEKGNKEYLKAKKPKIEAQIGNEKISYDDLAEEAVNSDVSERSEPNKQKQADPISKLVGESFYIQNKYEDWKPDRKGNRIRFSRFYPAKGLYIDIFDRFKTDEELAERRKLVEEHGKKYIPINYNETFDDTKIRSVLGV